MKMLNIIWVLLMIIGIGGSIALGKTDMIMNSIISSAKEAVEFAVGLIGIVSLWCGIIKILEDAGAVIWFSKIGKPILSRLFPSARKNEKAQNAIVSNFAANFLGLGNGATPSGIEAVAEMQNNIKDVCLFLVINSAGIQLLPTTVIAMRAELGASAPVDILIPTWIVSIVSMIFSLTVFVICNKLFFRKGGKV
jgi:spore maturation protein A